MVADQYCASLERLDGIDDLARCRFMLRLREVRFLALAHEPLGVKDFPPFDKARCLLTHLATGSGPTQGIGRESRLVSGAPAEESVSCLFGAGAAQARWSDEGAMRIR